LLGLVVVSCLFGGSRGVGVGDVKWNVFRFLGVKDCFVAATLASSANGDGVERGCRSGLISGRVGNEGGSLIVDNDPEDRVFVINWDHDCFVVDLDGVKGCSRSPGGPVVGNIEVSTFDKGSEEVELIVVGVHADKDDSIIGAQGEDGRGGES